MSVHNSLPNTPVNSEHGDDYIQDPHAVTRIRTENYQLWSCAMLLALEGKNKTGFIDGTCKRSNTYEILGKQWDRYDAMIELPKCVCNASESFKKRNQLLKLMQFLMGLDDSYMQIRSSILSREVLLDVRSAYATISSEESHRVAAGSIVGSSKGIRLLLLCLMCLIEIIFKETRLLISLKGIRCFKIIGYPVDFGKRKSNQSFKWKNISNNNYVGTSSSSGFIDEQMATLISLIKDNKVGKNVQANMAGANQHMTYTDKELDNVIDISHLRIKVGHPNGTEAYISKIRNLRLSNGLTLYDVMVIPQYCVTLISVHKLAKENKVIVAFDENRCYFLNQDLSLKNILGIGDQCEGLAKAKDSKIKKNDSTNVLQDVNHINFFDIEYPDILNDDERVENDLNRDKKSQYDSSSSSVSGSNHNIVGFPVDNPGNDADRLALYAFCYGYAFAMHHAVNFLNKWVKTSVSALTAREETNGISYNVHSKRRTQGHVDGRPTYGYAQSSVWYFSFSAVA
ncbi:ribonuclease H-like domain-containing protein [Tanacetum coccineum]